MRDSLCSALLDNNRDGRSEFPPILALPRRDLAGRQAELTLEADTAEGRIRRKIRRGKLKTGAGEENRTPVYSLATSHSTIEPHPRNPPKADRSINNSR